jgi:outer membrane protein OmpA-like peptidoglycan-associated protein
MKTHRIQLFLMIFVACVLIVVTPLLSYAQTRPRSDTPSESRKIIPVPRDQINVEAWFDKQCGASYRQGEKIVINFRTNVDGYVTVYDIDTRGQVSVLFPNQHYPDNFVRANQVYSMPNPSYTYDLIIEGPEGIEYVDVVASTDPYYHWSYNQGEPRWVYDWGLKGRQERDIKRQPSSDYERSAEYKNRPQQLGDAGKRSIIENYAKSQQLREQIRSKIVTRPRDTQRPGYEDYATTTCYFYVVAGQPDYPSRPQPQQFPSREEYIRRQQRDFQRIPGFDVSRSGDRLIVTMPNTILFDFDSYELRYEARRDLEQVANILLRYPETTIIVAGHTDSIGDAGYNQRLSEYRAQAVANYLISRGVQPYRISAVGYGETMPVASNASEAGRQRNRRVELDIRVNPQYGR